MTDQEMATITDRIMKAAAKGRREIVEDLVEQLFQDGRQDGMDALLIDLADAGELDDIGITFAVDNNGCTDPRRK